MVVKAPSKMSPSKRKTLKPKEVSLVTYSQENMPTLELPNDENKLFDEGDDIGNSTIPDLFLPREEDEKGSTINNIRE